MRIKVLGSAAGGGFPQWNCNYRLSRAVRDGGNGFRPRTQSSIAASADGRSWVLFNASPDVCQQISATHALQPDRCGSLRSSPIKAVVLTNADVDHIAGLLSLRERQPLAIYATERVLEVLESNSIFNVLDRACVARRLLPRGRAVPVRDCDGNATGIVVEAFAVPGKVALFLEDATREADGFGTEEGDTIGVRIAGEGDEDCALYIPGCARIDAALKERIAGGACLFFDGTLYTDDEMQTAGVGQKTGRRMGHVPMGGPEGSMALLAGTPVSRRIYIHINNTNPVLDENGAENAAVRANGWEIGYDGMEIML